MYLCLLSWKLLYPHFLSILVKGLMFAIPDHRNCSFTRPHVRVCVWVRTEEQQQQTVKSAKSDGRGCASQGRRPEDTGLTAQQINATHTSEKTPKESRN